jgi:hypothetical protein
MTHHSHMSFLFIYHSFGNAISISLKCSNDRMSENNELECMWEKSSHDLIIDTALPFAFRN